MRSKHDKQLNNVKEYALRIEWIARAIIKADFEAYLLDPIKNPGNESGYTTTHILYPRWALHRFRTRRRAPKI